MDESMDAETAKMAERLRSLGYVVARPYERSMYEGEGATEEFEVVPTSRQEVYEAAIAELRARLAKYER